MPNLVKVGYSGEIDTNHSSSNSELVGDLIKALCYTTGENFDDHVDFDAWVRNDYFLLDGSGKFVDAAYGKKRWNKPSSYDAPSSIPEGFKVLHTVKEWGKWFEWGFFKVRCYKKGTMHFEFKDEKAWGMFNQRIAKIKNYPLPEKKEQKI